MSRSQKRIQIFASRQKPESEIFPTPNPAHLRRSSILPPAKPSSLQFSPTPTPCQSQTPRSTNYSNTLLTPLSTRNSHHASLKKLPVIPITTEQPKPSLNQIVSSKRSSTRLQLPISLTPEEQKSRSEKYYREHLFHTFQSLKFIKNLPPTDPGQIRQKRIFLQKRPGFELKKTIIFDLDETLVHCIEDLNLNPHALIEIKFPTGEKITTGINIRPFARECLKEAGKHFEVIVFTASQQCYADAVLNFLDPKNELIHHRLYRENCIKAEGVYIKDLRIFRNRRLQDMIIVDNAVYSFANQLDNGIPIISWYDDMYDKELASLMEFLKTLYRAEDVREVNRQVFKLRNFHDFYIEEFLKR